MSFQIIRKIVSRGEVREKTLDVPGETLRIGRGVSNDLQLEDLSVSLNHAEIRCDEQGRCILRDTSQVQAMYVNRALVEEAILHHGDVIRIQQYLLSVSWADQSGPLVLTVEEAPKAKVEPSLALMPRLQLSGGQWTKQRIAAVLALLVLVGSVLALGLGQRTVFMPGAVSVKHSKFANQCEVCHASVKPVWKFVDNASCQVCHRSDILSPAHFRQEVALSPPPLCASCHLEHKGQKVLADVPDQKCVKCHGDLKAKDQSVPDIAAVHGFASDHPEFAISRLPPERAPVSLRVRLNDTAQLKDDGKLKLNHALHMKLEKDYLETRGIKPLTCTECHRSDDEGHYMQPISFQRDCAQCHAGDIELTPLLPGRSVTHGRQPEILRQQLDEIFSAVYLQAHPEEAKKPEHLRWIPGRRLPGQPQSMQERYVLDGRAEAEKVLFSPKVKKCIKCHTIEPRESSVSAASFNSRPVPASVEVEEGHDRLPVLGNEQEGSGVPEGTEESGLRGDNALQNSILDKPSGSEIPKRAHVRIARVNVPSRWLPYSRFDHQAHAALPELKLKGEGNWCVPCHENAPASLKTEDVLLPSIALCRTCHMETTGAQANCKSCHEFHAPKPPEPLSSVASENPSRQATP
jgi:FHA domain